MSARKKSSRPTDAELELLQVLWSKGPSTVREVHDIVGERRGVTYATVLKLLQIMATKNLVTRETDSMTHVYKASSSRRAMQRLLVADLVERAFEGSATSLAVRALEGRRSTPEELDEIRRLLDEPKRKKPT